MEKLLELARKASHQAEVYLNEHTQNTVYFKNARLHDIDTKFQSGVSLRIIKDGKLGFAYTKNLINRRELLENALDSLEGGAEASYDFPYTKTLPQLHTYESSLENLSSTEMVEECARVCNLLKSQIDAEISVTSFRHIENISIMNSEGANISEKRSSYGIYPHIIYPGSGTGIWRLLYAKKFEKMPDNVMNEMIELYKISSNVLEPKGGKMKVIFMPNSTLAFTWRISSGTSSKAVYERISPIADKIGEKIFHETITICDDPLNDQYPGARAFDDEGVACKPLTLVENGVLKSFYYDLNYAQKLNARPTGHGYKTARWGGDPISLEPVPALSHLSIRPGNKSFFQLVRSIDRGIVLEGALGAHSGNIPNGDYSVGVNPGLYVENGEIIGRVKDAMVAGNIYESLKHVVDVGDTLCPSYSGAWMPAILFDNVSVATKN